MRYILLVFIQDNVIIANKIVLQSNFTMVTRYRT